jgi:PPP family 3-phenylpropionic acid transporter
MGWLGVAPAPVLLFYFLHYASIGVHLPYMPQHLRSLGLSGSEIGTMAAVNQIVAFVSPPLWGFLSDRTRRGPRLLSLAALGGFLCFLPLLQARTLFAVAPWLLVGAFFFSPITMLIDSIALEHLRARGGDYSRVRLFGSLGFIASSTVFGQLYTGEATSPPLVVIAILGAVTLTFLSSFGVRGRSEGHSTTVLSLADALSLLQDRRVRLLLFATCLHWVCFTPYHMLFTIHLKDLGLGPSVAGFGFGLAVAAEGVAMLAYPRLSARFSPQTLLALAFGVSSLRWLGVGASSSAAAMILLQLLHCLSFGVFLCASIAYLTAVVPGRLRATGQALFVSVTYGLGGMVGMLVAGRLYDAGPARNIFFGAAAIEWLPALIVLFFLPALPRLVAPSPLVQSGPAAT